MDTDRKILLKKKLEENKLKLKNTKTEKQRKQIISCVDDFDKKYRFADESESEKLRDFISGLNFTSPVHILSEDCSITEHHNMYLCFLCGSKELLNTYLYLNYNDFLLDIDSFRILSSYLLLVDEDLLRFIYINDRGEIKESKIK